MNSLDRSRKEYDLSRSRLGLWTCLERLGIVDASYGRSRSSWDLSWWIDY